MKFRPLAGGFMVEEGRTERQK